MLKQKFRLQKMIRKWYTIRENCYYLTEETRGWKKGGSIWCSNGGLWWCWSMWTCRYFFIRKISEICNEGDLGLYRDDGLAIIWIRSSLLVWNNTGQTNFLSILVIKLSEWEFAVENLTLVTLIARNNYPNSTCFTYEVMK